LKGFNDSFILIFILFLGLVVSILLRTEASPGNYTSPDSFFYLQAAENLLTGKGMTAPYTYPFDNKTPTQYFAIWPIGYPLLIATVGLLIPNLLWASKVVNLLFLGGIVVLLQKRFGKYGPWAALAFVSYGMMEVFSHTWSEGPFLFFVLAFVFLLEKEDLSQSWRKLTFVLIALFTLRYAGIIFWGFLFFLTIYRYFILKLKNQKYIWYALSISALYIGAYLGFNYWLSGYLTGKPRIYPGVESLGTFIYYLSRGVLNIFAFARNFWSFGVQDLLALLLFLMQSLIIFFLIKKTKVLYEKIPSVPLYVSVFYLLGMIFLRIIYPYDPFDFRIMSPIIMLLYVYGLAHLGQLAEGNQKKKLALLSFLALSWMVNLPNKFLWEKWLGVWG
jgi:hypothetical protein